jgi:outer membrane lipoprotein-sorting protein
MTNLIKINRSTLSILISTALFSITAFSMTPDEMVKKADSARVPSGSIIFNVKVVDEGGTSPQKETRFRVSSKSEADHNYSLVETIYPERLQGRKLLMRDNDLWLYLPTISRPTRISLQERLSGEVSNGDIARTNFAGDYDASLVGNEKVDGKACVKLLLKAKHKDVTYSRIDYWLDAKTHAPVKAAFYALSGKLLKTGEYSAPKMILGSNRMTHLLIKDALVPTRRSLVEFSNFKQTELSDSLFNKETLSE